MRHLAAAVVVLCVIFGYASAQSRGSIRYTPPDEYDGESTRAPRPAAPRGTGSRRGQRPTKAPEFSVPEEDIKPYQPPESSVRTTGRRIPQRANTRHVAPPPPPPLPVLEPAQPPPVVETLDTPLNSPEERPQGARRRRPKKRRKNLATVPKVEEGSNKQFINNPETKESISELINDEGIRTKEFQSNQNIPNSPNYGSETNYLQEKSTGENNPSAVPHRNTAGPQYFRPQLSTSRLPLNNAEQSGNSGYLNSSPGNSNYDTSNGYIPSEHTSSRNEGNYVPVLSPIRTPSDGESRLPPEDFSSTRNREPTGHELPSDANVPFRAHGNTYPNLHERPQTVGSQPPYNINPESNDQTVLPGLGHSENRLPEAGQPLISPVYGSENEKKPSNRVLNPPDIRYDPPSSEYSDNPQRVARRQESNERFTRRTIPSSIRRGTQTQPREHDNDAETDHRQTSQYQPPLQRTSSRYKPDRPVTEEITRTRPQISPSPPPRGRGSSRYQTSTDDNGDNGPVRTTDSVRQPVEPSSLSSGSRSTSSSRSEYQARQRYAPQTGQNIPRTSSRRQPVPPSAPRNVVVSNYAPDDEIVENDQRSPTNKPRTFNQPPTNLRVEGEPENYPIRNTLRSRPQYEVRDSQPLNSYEESTEDQNGDGNEHHVPRTPVRSNQRAPQLRHPPPQPEYQPLQPRQHSRTEYDLESSQNPNARQQPQYHTPQNTRSRQQAQSDGTLREEYRQPSPRQNAVNSRHQGRPKQQDLEPPRTSGGSKFRCPEAFGFFADPVQCDKYYECRNGTAEMSLCSDGLAFNEFSAPKFLRCDSLRDVDCKSRTQLQEPRPSKNCPRQYGLFAHETDCTKFWNCVEGTATEVQCPPGLTYNDELGTCDWADLVKSSCKSEDLLGFTCPEPTAYDLQDGVYTSYPNPDNCQLHYICIKGEDGKRRPRLLTCNEGLVFDASTSSCTRPDNVAGCEDFYGPPPVKRRPAARQPAPREPDSEEDVYEEPPPKPTKPNRRTPYYTNRRERN